MRAWPYGPGYPATGHVTGRGSWHPGQIEGCPKCAPGIAHRCPECGKVWTTDDDPREWAYGHDCEV